MTLDLTSTVYPAHLRFLTYLKCNIYEILSMVFAFFLKYSMQGAIISIFRNEFVIFYVKIHFKRFKAARKERSP